MVMFITLYERRRRVVAQLLLSSCVFHSHILQKWRLLSVWPLIRFRDLCVCFCMMYEILRLGNIQKVWFAA